MILESFPNKYLYEDYISTISIVCKDKDVPEKKQEKKKKKKKKKIIIIIIIIIIIYIYIYIYIVLGVMFEKDTEIFNHKNLNRFISFFSNHDR